MEANARHIPATMNTWYTVYTWCILQSCWCWVDNVSDVDVCVCVDVNQMQSSIQSILMHPALVTHMSRDSQSQYDAPASQLTTNRLYIVWMPALCCCWFCFLNSLKGDTVCCKLFPNSSVIHMRQSAAQWKTKHSMCYIVDVFPKRNGGSERGEEQK